MPAGALESPPPKQQFEDVILEEGGYQTGDEEGSDDEEHSEDFVRFDPKSSEDSNLSFSYNLNLLGEVALTVPRTEKERDKAAASDSVSERVCAQEGQAPKRPSLLREHHENDADEEGERRDLSTELSGRKRNRHQAEDEENTAVLDTRAENTHPSLDEDQPALKKQRLNRRLKFAKGQAKTKSKPAQRGQGRGYRRKVTEGQNWATSSVAVDDGRKNEKSLPGFDTEDDDSQWGRAIDEQVLSGRSSPDGMQQETVQPDVSLVGTSRSDAMHQESIHPGVSVVTTARLTSTHLERVRPGLTMVTRDGPIGTLQETVRPTVSMVTRALESERINNSCHQTVLAGPDGGHVLVTSEVPLVFAQSTPPQNKPTENASRLAQVLESRILERKNSSVEPGLDPELTMTAQKLGIRLVER